MKELEWYTLIYNSNTKKLEKFNALHGISDSIKKHKKDIYDRSSLKNFLKQEFMYRYWSKYEFELLVSGLIESDFEKASKIDVWTQLEMNLDNIVDYINIVGNFKF